MTYKTREDLIAALPVEASSIGSFPEWTIHAVAENIWDVAFGLGCKDAQEIVEMFYDEANKQGFAGTQF